MRLRALLRLTLVSSLSALAATGHAQNLLVNGSLEAGLFTGQNPYNYADTTQLLDGATNITGWTTTRELNWGGNANPAVVRTFYGSRFVDLTGFNDSPPYGGIQQTVATTIGQRYTLSFAVGSHSVYGTPISVIASAGGVSSSFIHSPLGADNQWARYGMTFTADSASTLITVDGLSGGAYIGLDDLSLTQGLPTDPLSLSLSTGASNKQLFGQFTGGEHLTFTLSGNGDLVDNSYQVNPDGSLYAPASGIFSAANPNAAYPSFLGSDGVNHFAGGGANLVPTTNEFAFAGGLTTDTTSPDAIRLGAVVGTFSSSAGRQDWFPIVSGREIMVPQGGGTLYVAVNDTFNSDNHGTYRLSVNTSVSAVPEPSSLVFAGIAGLTVCGLIVRRRAR